MLYILRHENHPCWLHALSLGPVRVVASPSGTRETEAWPPPALPCCRPAGGRAALLAPVTLTSPRVQPGESGPSPGGQNLPCPSSCPSVWKRIRPSFSGYLMFPGKDVHGPSLSHPLACGPLTGRGTGTPDCQRHPPPCRIIGLKMTEQVRDRKVGERVIGRQKARCPLQGLPRNCDANWVPAPQEMGLLLAQQALVHYGGKRSSRIFWCGWAPLGPGVPSAGARKADAENEHWGPSLKVQDRDTECSSGGCGLRQNVTGCPE